MSVSHRVRGEREKTDEGLRAGLVGCGDVAPRYARALGEVVRGMRLTAVFDLDARAGREFARRHATECASSLDDLLARPLDLVCICTPNDTHAELAEACLTAGLHVLVEHPLAVCQEDADALCSHAERADRHLLVMRQRRFLGSVQRLRRWLEPDGRSNGAFSASAVVCWNRTASYFEARPWRGRGDNGGVLLNQASHFLDILFYLLGDPVGVDGVMGRVGNHTQVEDSFVGTLTFPRSVEVEFACTTAAPPGENWARLRLMTAGSSVALEGRAWERFEPVSAASDPGTDDSPSAGPLTGDHAGYLQRVVWRLGGRTVEIVSGREELRTLKGIRMIYETCRVDDHAVAVRWREILG